MENYIRLYTEFLNEADKGDESFEEFAKTRLTGASKISEAAKEKGGDALLTYHHFRVKLPYYEKAAEGNFDLEETKKLLRSNMKTLIKGVSGEVEMEQVDFQKVMGIIEVLGELIIRNKK
jgi:hypothetical protein